MIYSNLKIAFLLSVCGFIFSCGRNAVEKNAVGAVQETFGGEFNYSKQTSVSLDNKTLSYSLSLKNSENVEMLQAYPDLVTSGLALVFYDNLLNAKECDKISSEITFVSGKKTSQVYDCPTLKEVQNAKIFFNLVVDLLKDQRYDSLSRIINHDSAFGTHNKEMFVLGLKKADQDLGKLQDAYIIGFKKYVMHNQKNVRLSGMMVREKMNIPLSVDVNIESSKISFIAFKL